MLYVFIIGSLIFLLTIMSIVKIYKRIDELETRIDNNYSPILRDIYRRLDTLEKNH